MHPDVLTYAGAIATAGGTIGSTELNALNTWVWRGVTAGWYAKLKEVYPTLGSTLAAAAVKLKWGTSSTSTLDVSRLVSGDYSQAAGLGPTTYNSGKYVLTGWTPSNDGLTLGNFSAGLIRLDATRVAQALSVWLGDTPASGSNLIVIGSTNNNNSSSPRSDIGSQGYSFYQGAAWPRCDVMSWGSTTQRVWNNSSQGYYDTASLTDSISSEINIGRIRTGGIYRVEPFKMGMTFMGSALTDAEASDIGIATYLLEVAVGRTLLTGTPMYFVGDSITAGQGGYTYAGTYAYQVANAAGCRPLNLAVPGAWCTADSSGRKSAYGQRAELSKYPAGMVVCMLGTNDGQYDGVTNGNATIIADFKAKLIEMSNLWQGYGHTVLLCSLPYSTNTNLNATKRAAYATATSEAAAATGATFVDINDLMTNSVSPTPASMMLDATHPNPTGHTFIADAITSALAP